MRRLKDYAIYAVIVISLNVHYTSLVECMLFHSRAVLSVWSDMLCLFYLEKRSRGSGLLVKGGEEHLLM